MPSRTSCVKGTKTIIGCGGHRFKKNQIKAELIDDPGDVYPVREKDFVVALVKTWNDKKKEEGKQQPQYANVKQASALLDHMGVTKFMRNPDDDERMDYMGKMFGTDNLENISVDAIKAALVKFMKPSVLPFLELKKKELIRNDGKLAVQTEGFDEPGINRSELLSILLSWCSYINYAFDPRLIKVKETYQDMNQPMSHYFVASSHNTYLEGDQVLSKSTTYTIRRALLKGCRVVELDCYDGVDQPQYAVLKVSEHIYESITDYNNTEVAPIDFDTVARAYCVNNKWCLVEIHNSAFKQSDYPVILTIENHMSVEQQKIAAKKLKFIFDDKLAKPLKDGEQDFRSPESLKNKILLRDKMPKPKDWNDQEMPAFSRASSVLSVGGGGGEESSNKQQQVKFPKRHKDYAALVHVNNYKFKHIAIQEIFGNDKPGSASINESSLEKYVEKGKSKLIENFTRRCSISLHGIEAYGFEIMSGDETVKSQNAIPLIHLLEGVRQIPLFTVHNDPTLASILCHITFESEGSSSSPRQFVELPKRDPFADPGFDAKAMCDLFNFRNKKYPEGRGEFSRILFECSGRFPKLPECPRSFRRILETSGEFSNIVEDSRSFRNVLEFSGRFSKF
eukprot:jgi/Bigna1/145892/aug1.105_g20600